MNPAQTIVDRIDELDLWEETRILSRNQYLKVEGSIDTNIYFVNSGSLRIFLIEESEELTIRFAYQNNIVASLDSYLSEKASDFYIQALKNTELKVISKKSFETLIKDDDTLQEKWKKVLEFIILQFMERERDLLCSSPRERYERVLKRSPQLFQEVANKYIASYLRMTPETFSRLQKS